MASDRVGDGLLGMLMVEVESILVCDGDVVLHDTYVIGDVTFNVPVRLASRACLDNSPSVK